MGARPQLVSQRNPGRIDQRQPVADIGVEAGGPGRRIEEEPALGFEPPGHIDPLQERVIENHDMIGSVNIGTNQNLTGGNPQIGFNGCAAPLHPKERKALYPVARIKEGFRHENGGHDRTLTPTPMKANLDHGSAPSNRPAKSPLIPHMHHNQRLATRTYFLFQTTTRAFAGLPPRQRRLWLRSDSK